MSKGDVKEIVEFMIRYMETVIRRSFGTVEALKKGNTLIKRIGE